MHQAYVRAGADVIETNTFGANRDQAGVVRAGRQAARDQRRRGADRAPRGARPGLCRRRHRPARHPHRAVGQDRRRRSARATSASRRRRWLEGGVDLFILETFRDLNEIGAAIRAVRERLRPADRRADDDRGRRQHARRHAAGAVRARARALRRRRRRRQLQRRPGGDARDDRAHGSRSTHACGSRRSPTPASRARSRAATSTCARRNTWRRTRGGSSQRCARWSAAAAARRRSTSGRSRRRSARRRQPAARARPRRRRASPATAPAGGSSRRRCRATQKSRMAHALARGSVRGQRRAAAAARASSRRGSSSRRASCSIHGVDVVNIPDGPRASARMSALSLGRPDRAAGRHRDDAPLRLPRPEPARHAVGSARRARDGLRNLLLDHRRSAGRVGDYPDATGGLRRRFDRPDQRRVARLIVGCDIGGQAIGAADRRSTSAWR